MDGKWEVFETPDAAIEEELTQESPVATRNEDVVTDSTPPAEKVFEVFAGRRFFVDGKRYPRPEVEGKESTQLESPFERFNRLRIEVEDLFNDLQIDSAGDLETSGHSNAYEMLSKGVAGLKAKLDEMQHLEGVSTMLQKDFELSGGDSVEASRAVNQARMKDFADKLNAVTDQKSGKGGLIQYDLYYSTEARNIADKSDSSSLEARILRLEKLVGLDRASIETPELTGRPLSHVVSQLEERVSLLDEGKLRILSQKAKTLNADVEELTKARQRRTTDAAGPGASAFHPFTNEGEVHALVEKLSKCDSVAGVIPTLIERLRTVQEIHKHNANVHTRLDSLEKAQSDLEEANRLDRQLLENLKAGMRENIEIIRENLQAL